MGPQEGPDLYTCHPSRAGSSSRSIVTREVRLFFAKAALLRDEFADAPSEEHWTMHARHRHPRLAATWGCCLLSPAPAAFSTPATSATATLVASLSAAPDGCTFIRAHRSAHQRAILVAKH